MFVADALVPYLTQLVEGRPDDAFVFGGDEAPFDARAVARKAERAWKAADRKRVAEAAERDEDPVLLARFTLHEARHSFSTWLDHSGVSESQADRYMGHSSGTVASRYRHLLASQYADDAATFDTYVGGAAGGKVLPIARVAN